MYDSGERGREAALPSSTPRRAAATSPRAEQDDISDVNHRLSERWAYIPRSSARMAHLLARAPGLTLAMSEYGRSPSPPLPEADRRAPGQRRPRSHSDGAQEYGVRWIALCA